ncbi:MAG: hypothetical protein HZB91_06940 [Elusimicrobia bacterium]|nr:hypothetical protein [Elusimicrobiota bacterium]
MGSKAILPYLCLAAAVIASFGIHSHKLGFYYDDWTFLEMMHRGGGFVGAVKAFSGGGYWTRPVEILQFPLFFAVGGLKPLSYHLLMVGLEIAEALLFYAVLKRLLGSPRLALAAALLAAIYPNRSITHIWFAASPQTVALVLVLASMAVFLTRAEGRRLGLLLASQGLYLASVLTYESTAFLPLLITGGLAAGTVQAGRCRGSLPRSLAALWPYGLSLGLALAFQRFAGTVLQGSNPKVLGLSLSHGLKVFGAGFECVTNRVLHLVWLALPGFLAGSDLIMDSAWLALGLAAASAFAFQEDLKAPSFRAAGYAAGACFIGAYLPYALSQAYTPQIFGLLSRTNGGGALAGGLMLACAAAALSRLPLLQKAFLGLTVLAFTAVNWHAGRTYAALWDLEERILAAAAPAAAALPAGATVLFKPRLVPGSLTVFMDHFDFSSALRLASGRDDLSADVVSGAMEFGPDQVVKRGPAGTQRTYPYQNLYLFSESESTMKALISPRHPSR